MRLVPTQRLGRCPANGPASGNVGTTAVCGGHHTLCVVSRRDGTVGGLGCIGCLVVGVGVAAVLLYLLSSHQVFASVDPTGGDLPGLLRLGAASFGGLVAGGYLFTAVGRLMRGSEQDQAARRTAQAETAARFKEQRAREEAAEAERRAKARVERLAHYPVGSDEWWQERHRHHRDDVRRETGVSWHHSLYSHARTPAERTARELMQRLSREAKAMVSQVEAEARNRTLTVRERQGGISDWRSAERFVASWMRQAFDNVALTASGADEGIDVVGDGVAAQVKFQTAKVGRPALQRLLGAAGESAPLFFTLEAPGYTSAAVQWADDHAMALYTYDWQGIVRPANSIAATDPAMIGASRQHTPRRSALSFGRALEVVDRWLAAQLPDNVTRVSADPADSVHLTTARLAIAVCVSPTNAVGTPRLLKLVDNAQGRRPLLFVSVPGGLSPTATNWAAVNGVAVFGVTEPARVASLNDHARQVEATLRVQGQ